MPLTTLHALLLDASDAGLARLAAAHGSGPEVRTCLLYTSDAADE